MSEVKRHEPEGSFDGCAGWMRPEVAGDWVSFKDHTALRARLEEVEAQYSLAVEGAQMLAERAERAEAALRMIVSHATGGATTGEGMSVNDISVRITAFRNVVYEGGKDVGAKKAEAALATARRDALEDLVAIVRRDEQAGDISPGAAQWFADSASALIAQEAETSARGMP